MGRFLLTVCSHVGFGLRTMFTLSVTDISKKSIVKKNGITEDRRPLC